MTKRQFVDKNGNTWEWEETDEVRAAVERLHQDIRKEHLSKKEEDKNV